jgi:hypothetical protein
VHEGAHAFVGFFVPFGGEVSIDQRSFELGVPQGALEKPRIDAGFKQRGGVGMPQRMDGHTHFGHAGPVGGFAEGALDTAAAQGGGRPRTVGVIPPGGGTEPGLMTMGFPGGAQQRASLGRQRDVPVLGPLAAVDRDLEAWAIDVRDLEEEGFMEPKPQAVDGGEVALIVQGSGGRQEPPALLHTKDSWEAVGALSAHERQRGPVALENVRREEADATVAETHGRRGQAIDVFPVQEGVLQLLFREAVGGFVGELSQQADFPDIRFLSPFALATELESRKHLLAQWSHETSPFVRRVVRLRRKTS